VVTAAEISSAADTVEAAGTRLARMIKKAKENRIFFCLFY
jgi:hypothetical protein